MNVELYVNLRPCSEVPEGYLIVGLSRNINGPYFVFRKEHRLPGNHPMLVAKLGLVTVKQKKNVKIKFSGPLLKAYVDVSDPTNLRLCFRGRQSSYYLQQVTSLEPVGHHYSFTNQLSPSDQSFVSIANYDQFVNRFDDMHSSGHNSTTQTSSPSLHNPIAETSFQPLHNTSVRPSGISVPPNTPNSSFSINLNPPPTISRMPIGEIRTICNSMSDNGMIVYEPMQHEIVLWFSAFERQLAERNALDVAKEVLVEFLDAEVGLPFYYEVIGLVSKSKSILFAFSMLN